MKKLKNEKELLKTAMQIGQAYAVKAGYSSFSPTDSADNKVEAIYRLLVNDKLIAPLPAVQESAQNFRHRLVKWIAGKLPADHPLLK
ncbi:DUF5062 family protein [Ferrimonas lipolytica]|uniref:DUF5062 family protein n=1 Tax=Ferrimonas lipolytica TaxID=2724191 RepID=A0A6H1UE92_9GAMM|nr:DUF5062 family protein [Ferrimonas lipolytica]QIZ76949.1 DUF5062 family protein [Ferrimonas lipolytica]